MASQTFHLFSKIAYETVFGLSCLLEASKNLPRPSQEPPKSLPGPAPEASRGSPLPSRASLQAPKTTPTACFTDLPSTSLTSHLQPTACQDSHLDHDGHVQTGLLRKPLFRVCLLFPNRSEFLAETCGRRCRRRRTQYIYIYIYTQRPRSKGVRWRSEPDRRKSSRAHTL